MKMGVRGGLQTEDDVCEALVKQSLQSLTNKVLAGGKWGVGRGFNDATTSTKSSIRCYLLLVRVHYFNELASIMGMTRNYQHYISHD